MDLDLAPEQEMLRDMVRGVCREYCPVSAVREAEEDPRGFPPELWKQMGELGLTGLLVPEAHGGSGQGLLDAALVYEELGRALAPSPHFVSCVLGAGALLDAGSDAQQAEWLPRLAAGQAIWTPAWLEPERGFGPQGVRLRAERDGDALVLSGSKRHVPFANSADRLLVLARTGEGDEDVDLLLVDPAAPGVTLRAQQTLASDCQHEVRFEGVRVPAGERLGAPGGGWATWERVLHDGIILLAAQAVGGAARALEITVDYAKERQQFGRPLGAFQAIAHYLADASTAVDGARTLVHQAAWARSTGRSTARLAPMAKLFACQAFRDVTAMCQQVWGGVGFTIEYDIQLYFRRAKQLQISWWDSRHLEELIARQVLDPAAPGV